VRVADTSLLTSSMLPVEMTARWGSAWLDDSRSGWVEARDLAPATSF
jgi:hypothetical protein